jgi:hypothetical protein
VGAESYNDGRCNSLYMQSKCNQGHINRQVRVRHPWVQIPLNRRLHHNTLHSSNAVEYCSACISWLVGNR